MLRLLSEIRMPCPACHFVVRFQRFYYCKSFAEYDVPILERRREVPIEGCWRSLQVRSLAAAALVLASKPPCGVWGTDVGPFHCFRTTCLSC